MATRVLIVLERVSRDPHHAIDPPHCAASPAVPALIGSGYPKLGVASYYDPHQPKLTRPRFPAP
jgi:hypothetical protein